jgi:capsular polysaccharide biosynthesis protein
VFKTREVNQQVAQNLQLNYTYGQLQGMLRVENPSDTRILNIIVASKNPVEAMNIANEYANVARTYIADKMATEEPSILSVAQVPTEPSKPNKKLNTILGFFLGAFVSLGVIVVRFLLDDKIKTADDIRTYVQLSTLAVLPQDDGSLTAGERHPQNRAQRHRGRGQERGVSDTSGIV